MLRENQISAKAKQNHSMLLKNLLPALAWLVAFSWGAAAQAQNLLADPGFETGGVPAIVGGIGGWTTFNEAGFVTFPVLSGVYSMINAGIGGFSVPGAFQTLPAAPGMEYDLTGFGYAPFEPSPGMTFGALQITFFDGPGGTGDNLGTTDVSAGGMPTGPGNAQLSGQINSSSPTGVWIPLDTGIAQAPPGAESLQVFTIVVDQNPAIVFFDDLSLVLVPEPSPMVLIGAGVLGLFAIDCARRKEKATGL
jgi:hypothetical protein